MRVHLIAVQAEIRPEAYWTPDAFRQRVHGLAEQAVARLPAGSARVIAFPETFSLPLLFWLNTPDAVRRQQRAAAAALWLLRARWRDALQCMLRRRVLSPAVLYHLRGPQVWPVYEQAFRDAARMAGAYVVAGSLFSPLIDWEPGRGYHVYGRGAYNVTLVLSPRGTVLARVPKLRLTPLEARSWLTAAPGAAQVVDTEIGKIATLICLDAFHEALVEQVDAAGAWLLIQPSANDAAWTGPWPVDPRQIEGEVWLREGLAKKLTARENLRYGINPMLNGRLYETRFEGRSSIAAAGRYLAVADAPSGDAIVRAEVEIDDARRGIPA
jgi:predicted amidohydrolase